MENPLLISLLSALVFSCVLAIQCQLLPIVTDTNQDGIPGTLQVYIVHVEDPVGGVEGYTDQELESWHRSFLPNATLDSGEPRMIYSYRHAIGGFAARLTPEEVTAMESMEGFLLAHPSGEVRAQTTKTPEFLGLDDYQGLWYSSKFGEGKIIGVIDTGITPTHPSFQSFQGMKPKPIKWQGNCNFSAGCSNKLIGAMAFQNGAHPSPLDDNGHGTHCAGTAGGSAVYDAGILDQARGKAVGTAPRAHLAAYKVLYGPRGKGQGHNMLAGIDRAIRDGVDVLSMSLGSGAIPLYISDIAKSSFRAIVKDIIPVACAMNEGPTPSVISNDAPWILTVGASTTDRRITSIVKLGNNMKLEGESAYQPSNFNSTEMDIVFPGSTGISPELYCEPGSLAKYNVTDKIVLCAVGATENTEKGEVVKAAGGKAMILMNTLPYGYTTFADPHVIAASHVSNADVQHILAYLKTTANPKATIFFQGTTFGNSPAPSVAFFSGRGPSNQNGGIIKPDILAPGVNILAAWPKEVGPNPSGTTNATFNFESGTSMATPHVAGIVADLKKNHEDWSPAAIKSAIMTTAYTENRDGNPITTDDGNKGRQPATYFAMGAGHINPDKANDPGLVYDLEPSDYIPYLCGLFNSYLVQVIVRQRVDCAYVKTISPEQLNYPSIAVSMTAWSTIKVTRTLKNVVAGAETYDHLDIKAPDGVDVMANTSTLVFPGLNATAGFELEIKGNGTAPRGKVSEGYLIWSSGKHDVRSPISVTFI